ncbi:uncharacterized protein BX663DRAFT_148302 [Cokeromyces recurvatus]|uniref:uncharacterized protein n=1 Tax=Cokeromyces recurvatus TaxID=90255 RepID=UPI002220879F|nr:uncharacterized protein BX663DRAFT_148302 [Cokeromyces recurvatus]KAI7900827.1 hypothetical protein BX663DRAFT_148302 [Cokeromyces recurvatus]
MAHKNNVEIENEINQHEETHRLMTDHYPHYYGSVISPITSSSPQGLPYEDIYSEESSEEFISSVNLVNRKKKRLQKHHRSSKPKLVKKLSYIVGSARQSEEESELGDIIDMPSNDLIIPELDPNADEVKNYIIPSKSNWLSSKKHRVNLSNIRENYRNARIRER